MRYFAATALVFALTVTCLAQTTAGTRNADDHTREDQDAARMNAAQAALETHDLRTAETLLQQLANDHPKDAHVLYDLGYAQQNLKEIDAAEKSFKAAIALDPAYVEPHEGLGFVYAARNNEDAARAEWLAAAHMPSASPDLRARLLRVVAYADMLHGRASEANDEMLEAIKLNGEQPGDAELAGNLALAAKDFPAAELQLTKALAAAPDDLRIRVSLGSAMAGNGKRTAAIEVLQTGLKTDPRNVSLNVTLAQLESEAGRPADAVKVLEDLRSAAPETKSNILVSRVLARLYLLDNRPADAEPLAREVAATDARNPAALDTLGETLVRQQKYAEAERVLATAVTQRAAFHDDHAWADAAFHLAFAAQKNHDPAVALRALQARATVLPDSATSLFLQATANDDLHHREDAAKFYRAFLAVAGGKFPDEEFEARHRLVALQHEK